MIQNFVTPKNHETKVSKEHRLKKEDIGCPSNMVHGAGLKASKEGFQVLETPQDVRL